MGRAFGGMMKTIQQQNEAARSLQEEAAHAIRNDPEVQQQLGGSIRVDSPFSQQQSTMSINGRTMQRVSWTWCHDLQALRQMHVFSMLPRPRLRQAHPKQTDVSS